jgi:hypothetical protein
MQPQQKLITKKRVLIICGFVLALLATTVAALSLAHRQRPVQVLEEMQQAIQQVMPTVSEAEKAGRELSRNNCNGKGPVALTVSPMKAEDIAMVIPYGLMVDGHVTPIDHQYFSPADFNSAPDSYEVRALADGRITEISHRGQVVGGGGKPSNDYRFVFAHTCTFLTYFDLVTSLAPDIKAEFDKHAQRNGPHSRASLDIPVKAGQVVGRIGGQTLDFAVWDTEKPLKGFITPDLYKGEAWKIYTADPLDYYSQEVKDMVLQKYLRTDQGKSGRIDWDIDGKLIGNWFQEGTNGYEGDRDQRDGRYWRGHLAIAPDHLDPRFYIASFGTWAAAGDGEQFVIKSPVPNPASADQAANLIKYELVQWSYMANGRYWDRRSPAKNPHIDITKSTTKGCALFQLLEARKLKAEPFPGRTCSTISGFTPNAKIYIR